MKPLDRLKNTRNIGIAAHIDAGKTTLTERILFYTGRTHKIGEVHDGEAVMDWMEEEQERGITITSAVTTCQWSGRTINIIDTPGHVDFTIEVERSLRVLDGAVAVFCAVGGVEAPVRDGLAPGRQVQGPTGWPLSTRWTASGRISRMWSSRSKTRLGGNPLVLTLPIGAEDTFSGLIDLLTLEQVTFGAADLGAEVIRSPLPEELTAVAEEARENLLEKLAEADEEILEPYLEGEELSLGMIKAAIRRATLANGVIPVFCGTACAQQRGPAPPGRNPGLPPLAPATCPPVREASPPRTGA